MSERIRVAIVDDHPMFRDGLRIAFRGAKGIELIAEGASASDAKRIAEELSPDIMVLDITMPGGGIDAALAISKAWPAVRLIMLTGSDDEETASTALAAGARGYLVKGADTAELLKAVRNVYAGQPYVTSELSSRLAVRAVRPRRSVPTSDLLARLSAREQDIINGVFEGKTNQEIADELGLALPTVKNTMSRIFTKLRVRNRTEAILVRDEEAESNLGEGA